MIGSVLVVETESRVRLERFLPDDIWSRSGVWRSFEIYLFKRAV